MRTIELGGKKLGLRARPSALRVYQQAFGKDLIAEMQYFQGIGLELAQGNISGFNSMLILQIVYALHQASDTKKVLPHFDEWLDSFEYISFADPSWIMDVIEEVTDGFFRAPRTAQGAGKEAPKETEQRPSLDAVGE